MAALRYASEVLRLPLQQTYSNGVEGVGTGINEADVMGEMWDMVLLA